MKLKYKIGYALLGTSLLLPTTVYAISFDPVRIDSSQGEPLYAEISFHNAQSKSPVNVSIAQPFEYGQAAAFDPNKYSYLNFYVRQSQDGNGIIIITSSRIISEPSLDIALKIKDNDDTEIQQIRQVLPTRIDRLKASLQDQPLQPYIVNNDQDIKLDLPESSVVGPTNPGEQFLMVNHDKPPQLDTTPSSVAVKNTVFLNTSAITAQTTSTPAKNTASSPAPQQSTALQQNSANPQNSAPIKVVTPMQEIAKVEKPITAQQPSQTLEQKPSAPLTTKDSNTEATTQEDRAHTVKSDETLWGIANLIAAQDNLSTQQVMQALKQANPHAFIRGNINLLKQGTILDIPAHFQALGQTKNSAVTRYKPQSIIRKAVLSESTAARNSQNHLSIVSSDQKGTLQGTQSKGRNADTKMQNELTLQLTQIRLSSLILQDSVRRLDQTLRSKAERINILNARLAELAEQLKQRQIVSKPNTKHPSS